MNKQDLLLKVGENHEDLSKKKVAEIVGEVFDAMSGALQGGDKVAWPGFGTFSVTERAARKGRNPRTGDPIDIKASKGVKFKLSSTMKEKL